MTVTTSRVLLIPSGADRAAHQQDHLTGLSKTLDAYAAECRLRPTGEMARPLVLDMAFPRGGGFGSVRAGALLFWWHLDNVEPAWPGRDRLVYLNPIGVLSDKETAARCVADTLGAVPR